MKHLPHFLITCFFWKFWKVGSHKLFALKNLVGLLLDIRFFLTHWNWGLLIKAQNSTNYQSNRICYSPQRYWPSLSKEICFSLREVVICLFPTFCPWRLIFVSGKINIGLATISKTFFYSLEFLNWKVFSWNTE